MMVFFTVLASGGAKAGVFGVYVRKTVRTITIFLDGFLSLYGIHAKETTTQSKRMGSFANSTVVVPMITPLRFVV